MLKQLEKSKTWPEIQRPYSTEFRRSSYIVESAPGVEIEDLLDPMAWGRQPHLRKFDQIEISASDGAFYVVLLVESVTGGVPIVRLLWQAAMETRVEEATTTDRVEYDPVNGWTLIINDEPAEAGFADRPTAEAALEKRLEEAAS